MKGKNWFWFCDEGCAVERGKYRDESQKLVLGLWRRVCRWAWGVSWWKPKTGFGFVTKGVPLSVGGVVVAKV